jgi:quercetin dioxygenase-like cupin family protein
MGDRFLRRSAPLPRPVTSPDGAADLLALAGIGPVWGVASQDLNATLLAWPAGHLVDEHVNPELDVLLVVLAGGGDVRVDARSHSVAGGSAVLIEKGRARSIRVGPDGIRYLSVHRRRGPLELTDERQASAPRAPARPPRAELA